MTALDAPASPEVDEALPVSERLARLADDAPGETVTLGWLLDQLGERAFGLFLLVLALPCAVPFLYGVPQIVSLPLLFVTGQMVAGRHAPWLPERLSKRTIAVKSLRDLTRRAGPYLRFVEHFLRPRLQSLSHPPLDRIVALALVVFSLSIMVPLPLTNTLPGIAVALVALGFLQRDGLMILAAVALGSAWVSFLIYVAIYIPAKLFGA